MEPHRRSDLQKLKLRNQIRFLIYLYWLKLEECFYLFKSQRAKVHWLGHDRRPRRLERALGLFIFCGGLIFLEMREYMLWSAVWGSALSAFVVWRSFYKLIPHKQYHWVHDPKGS